MKYWIKRSVLPFGIVCLMSMALFGCGREKKEAVTVQPELVIGSDDYEPYNYQDENGDYAGVDVELAKEACRRIGYTPVFKQIQWDDKDIYLENGEVDCAWGSFSMDGREVVMVRTDSDIYKLDDLAGKNVAVQSSTQPERIFLGQGYDIIPKVKNVYSFVEMNELFAALRKGYVDACAGHEIVMQEYLRQSGQKYRILDEEIIDSKLGVAFSKNKDTQKAEQLRQAMAEMLEDGTVQCILEKYGMEDRVAAGGITP